MNDRIISYLEMCQIEGVSLQQGMNFGLNPRYSVILMSTRRNAPYKDQILEDGVTLIYEGHDAPRSATFKNVKEIDQPGITAGGSLTQNGKFFNAALDFKKGLRDAELVRVYEKIRNGIWSDNAFFDLVDSWIESDGLRKVYKFKLQANEIQLNVETRRAVADREPRRVIPTSVKLQVWARDGGKCIKCGSDNELHFDHLIPFAKGGTSVLAENIQLLCARHNLEKSDNIE